MSIKPIILGGVEFEPPSEEAIKKRGDVEDDYYECPIHGLSSLFDQWCRGCDREKSQGERQEKIELCREINALIDSISDHESLKMKINALIMK